MFRTICIRYLFSLSVINEATWSPRKQHLLFTTILFAWLHLAEYLYQSSEAKMISRNGHRHKTSVINLWWVICVGGVRVLCTCSAYLVPGITFALLFVCLPLYTANYRVPPASKSLLCRLLFTKQHHGQIVNFGFRFVYLFICTRYLSTLHLLLQRLRHFTLFARRIGGGCTSTCSLCLYSLFIESLTLQVWVNVSFFLVQVLYTISHHASLSCHCFSFSRYKQNSEDTDYFAYFWVVSEVASVLRVMIAIGYQMLLFEIPNAKYVIADHFAGKRRQSTFSLVRGGEYVIGPFEQKLRSFLPRPELWFEKVWWQGEVPPGYSGTAIAICTKWSRWTDFLGSRSNDWDVLLIWSIDESYLQRMENPTLPLEKVVQGRGRMTNFPLVFGTVNENLLLWTTISSCVMSS
jgi:hypothetical protein